MKYPKELYIESGFYGGDEEIENYTEKVVKCRKNHKCSECQNGIQAGEEAVFESGFMDGHPVSNYICLPCIEAWLEESGQVDEGGGGRNDKARIRKCSWSQHRKHD